MHKRIISLILTLIMLITMVPSTIVAASEVRTMEGVEASSNQSEATGLRLINRMKILSTW